VELHLISNGKQRMEEFCDIAASIHEYVSYFHIRERTWTAKGIYESVKLLVAKGVPLSKIIINDRVDVGVAMRVAGVQLAYHSMPASLVKTTFPTIRIGSSIHSLEDLKRAEEWRADFVLYGHIFETASKPGFPAKGLIELRKVTENARIPVIAIGGIKPHNIRKVLEAGAAGVAVMSGILEAENPLEAVKTYSSEINSHV
jgi:thiazole tautomerase (transcriptional regulator TenI)